MAQILISEQKGGFDMVSPSVGGVGFKLHGEGYRVIERASALVPDTKRKSPRKTTEVAIDAVILLFHGAIAGLKMVAHAKSPVRIESIVKSGVDDVVVGEIDGEEAERRDLGVGLRKLAGTDIGAGHKDIIDRGFDDMAEVGDIEEFAAGSGIEARGFERGFHAGVEDKTLLVIEMGV